MENKKIDYKNLKEIIVTNQEGLDNIPLNFKGQIYIDGGTLENEIKINNNYNLKPKVINNSVVRVYKDSSILAYNYSEITAFDNSYVFAHDNSLIKAYTHSNIIVWDNSQIIAHRNSSVTAFDNSYVVAYDNSNVDANGNSQIIAYGYSNIVAHNNTYIETYDNSHVKVYDNGHIEAHGNSQILDMQEGAKIKISGNARIIYMPKNINEFMNFHEIKHTKTKAIFYKAVHKDENGIYRADADENFIYEIGKYKTETCDEDVNVICSYGINISTLNFALNFGANWNNLAILEVETNIKDIVMPISTNGKVRTSRVKVIREIPLEECGLLGKNILKRR